MDTAQPNVAASHVYFIQHGDWGPVKIGVAVDPEQRRRELQTGNPEQLHIRTLLPGDRTLEAELHRRFADWHLHGEWFGGGEQSAAILAFAGGIDERGCAEYWGIDEAVDWVENARWPISPRERLDLRYDIERLWLRRLNPAEIAAELDGYWGLSEAAIRQEIKAMRKSSVWDIKGRPPGMSLRPVRGAA